MMTSAPLSGQSEPSKRSESKSVPELSTSEYFMVVSEIDASYFVLEQIIGKYARRAPITQIIDKATGYDAAQLKEIKSLVSRIKKLQAKLPPDDWHFKQGAINRDGEV